MQTLKLTKKYEKYPEYKDSGVEWLGKIPKDWSVTPLRSVARENQLKNSDGSCQNLLSLSYGKIIEKDINSNEGLLPESFNTYQVVNKGNIVFRLTDLQNDKRSLRVGYVDSDEPGIITSAYLALNIENRIDAKYAYYLLHSYDLQKVYYGMGGGVRQTLDFHDFKYLPIIMPDLKDQMKIASFLDEKIKAIEQIILKKNIQLELLKERCTAFINHTLSKVEGETTKIKNHTLINPTKKEISDLHTRDLVSFVPMEALSEDGDLKLQEKKYEEVKNGFTYFRDEDVVLAKITPCFENGKAGVMRGLKNGFGFGTTEFMVLRPQKTIISDYLYYLIFSDKFRKSGEVEMKGTAGQKRVTANFVRNYEFSLPNLSKQREIVSELNSVRKIFTDAINKTTQSIEELKELKFSLILSVVTGKIKV